MIISDVQIDGTQFRVYYTTADGQQEYCGVDNLDNYDWIFKVRWLNVHAFEDVRNYLIGRKTVKRTFTVDAEYNMHMFIQIFYRFIVVVEDEDGEDADGDSYVAKVPVEAAFMIEIPAFILFKPLGCCGHTFVGRTVDGTIVTKRPIVLAEGTIELPCKFDLCPIADNPDAIKSGFNQFELCPTDPFYFQSYDSKVITRVVRKLITSTIETNSGERLSILIIYSLYFDPITAPAPYELTIKYSRDHEPYKLFEKIPVT